MGLSINREKVVGHLYDCLAASRLENTWVFVRKDIVGDALALLKEQEAVKPVKQIEENEWTVCGHCREHLISKWMFCPYCGRAVKWK